MSKVIHQYIRDRKGNRKGVLVGMRNDVELKDGKRLVFLFTGYSLCKTKLDRFDVERGKELAINRIKKDMTAFERYESNLSGRHKHNRPVPASIVVEFNDFSDRTLRYFGKDLNAQNDIIINNFDTFDIAK